jgi:glycosyltransferase involved in cell wall biosynthesis
MHHGVNVTLVLPMNLDELPDGHLVRGPGDAPAMEGPQIRFVKSTLQPYEGFAEFAVRMQGQPATMQEDAVQELYGPNLGEAVWRFGEQAVAMTHDLTPDVIHCHDWMTYEAGINASKHHDKPLVAHIHATELDRTDFKPNEWIANQERRGFMAAHKIIAVSNYTKNILVNHYGIHPDKISVVYNGHETHARVHDPKQHLLVSQARAKKAPLVLFLGRLTVQKNPMQFLESARLIHDVRPDVQFVMAGDGGMLGELMDSACRMGLGENMIFTGKVGRREADQLYKNASCFVMPSLSEPFGLVALEAIGHGVPVVLSKQSGAAEVIDHAFKVDFWDTERMADCILTILREEPLSRQMMSEAPRILQRLTWANQAKDVVSLYRNLLQS